MPFSFKSRVFMSAPYLYSLQHCPYAIRARLGLLLAEQHVMVRAVDLRDKPAELLAVSEKGTVPILVLPGDQNGLNVIVDESLDIMLWALKNDDPNNLLYSDTPAALSNMLDLISQNDTQFIPALDKYKQASRYHDPLLQTYREGCQPFIAELEQMLEVNDYFMGSTPSLADYALLPFIRQFAKVERKWYLQSPYPRVRAWLNNQLQQPLFTKAMAKFPLWTEHHQEFLLGR
jgi:glutathione S-transferase